MKSRYPAVALILAFIIFPIAARAGFSSRVAAAVDDGTISREEALVQLFSYAFDPTAVRPNLADENDLPLKCFTGILEEYRSLRGSLAPATATALDAMLASPGAAGKVAATYTSPAGYFTLTYSTSGGNAVPSADVNPANGVPDYVERVAEYADSSWNAEIVHMGFEAPVVGGGTYAISFQNMGAYGYTVSTGGGSSYIVVENDFAGFPSNSDPDGNQLGAAKATVAHEFKHASQMNTGSWGGWEEMDATWMEDMVFDDTNDYYNYLSSGNNIVAPGTPLDSGGGASYEDCIWQHYIEEDFGPGTVLEHAIRRRDFPLESVTTSYNEVFLNHGSSFRDGFTNFAVWNYLVGTFATTSLPGYGEAAAFPVTIPGTTANLTASSYPYTTSGTIPNMASHVFKCKGMTSLTGTIRVQFAGLNANRAPAVVALLKVKSAYGGGWEREDIPLDASLTADYTVSRPASELSQVAVLVVYPKKSGGDTSYDLTISDGVVTTGVADAIPGRKAFGLEPNRPNPFNPTTSISFVLPGPADASLVIYNTAGRLVRSLVSGEQLTGGTHTYGWDGLDDAGLEAPSGVYFYRLDAGRLSDSKRMLLIR